MHNQKAKIAIRLASAITAASMAVTPVGAFAEDTAAPATTQEAPAPAEEAASAEQDKTEEAPAENAEAPQAEAQAPLETPKEEAAPAEQNKTEEAPAAEAPAETPKEDPTAEAPVETPAAEPAEAPAAEASAETPKAAEEPAETPAEPTADAETPAEAQKTEEPAEEPKSETPAQTAEEAEAPKADATPTETAGEVSNVSLGTVKNELKSDGTSDPIVADDTQGTSGKATPFLDETIDGDNVNGDPITVGDSSIARDSLVMRGDIALAEGKDVNISKEDEPSKYNTTDNKPVEINKNEKYALRADLDVSAVGNAMYALEKFAEESLHISAFSDIYVTNFKTGFRAVYELSDNIDGSFFVSKFDHDQEEERTKELKEHYKLIATSKDENGDPEPLLYAINYARSEFTEKKVSILMDLILDNVTEKVTAYNGGSDGTKVWGKNGVQEDFNHSGDDYGTTYNTSVYGNMKNMVLESAKKMAILIDDITIKDVEGKPDPTDNLTKGTINGTIVGYMSASIGHGAADIEFKWGAMQDDNKGKDIAIKSQPENHKIQLTIAKKTPGKEDSTDDSNDGGTDNPGDNPGGSDSNKDTKKTDADTEKEDTKKTSEESSKKTESEGIVSVTSAPVAPQTGDNAPIGAYAALMMGAMAAAGALYLKRKED